jgi:hypothetical protein
MTHYGPSPPPPSIGVAGDSNKITLSLTQVIPGWQPKRVEKELNYDEAVELARRLLNEATPLLKRRVLR